MTEAEQLAYIDEVLDGNISAFEYLVNHHKGMVHTIALRIMKSQEDAEEVAQDSFLKAFQKLSSFKRGSKFSTWMYRIVYNTAISRTRKKQLDTSDIEDEIADNFNASSAEETLSTLRTEEQRKYINAAIEKLASDDGLLLTLFYLEENTVDEIISITGWSTSNVKVKLHRARKKLLYELEQLLQGELRSIL